MESKKIIIAGITVFVFAFLALTFYFWNSSKKSEDKPAAPTPIANPQYPTGGPPVVKKNSNAPVIIVENSNSQEDISKTVSQFSSKNIRDMEFTSVTDKDRIVVSLDQFLSSMEASVNPSLKNLLDLNNYYLISCGSNNGKKELGLVLDIKLLPDYKGNLYQDELNIMKEWEPTMLGDIKNIIFPDVNFTQEQLKQTLNFKDGTYRFSEIVLPNNKKDSLNYTLLDDFVIISNSVACMDKTAKAFLN
jgi:hypothetical protein